MKKNLILGILFLITLTALCGCKAGATKEETKIFQEHSRLCKTEIHMQWQYYKDSEKAAITKRFQVIESLFNEILKEK